MNLDILWDAADGDTDFARDLADLYRNHIAEQLALLRAALAAHSASDVQCIAHHCKGSSHTCGATALASLFGELARLGLAGQLEEAAGVVADVEREFARVQAILETLAPQPAATEPAA